MPLLVGAAIVMFGGALSLGILMAPLMLGFVKMCFRVVEGEKVEIGQITDGFSSFLSAFLLGVFVIAAVIITSCTIVGPIAVVFVCMFGFQFLARDESIGAVDALKASFELVKANMGLAGAVFLISMAINSVLGGGTGILGIPAYAFTTFAHDDPVPADHPGRTGRIAVVAIGCAGDTSPSLPTHKIPERSRVPAVA